MDSYIDFQNPFQIPKWHGSGSTPVSCSFNHYATDALFQSDAPKVADWIAKSLGYPIVDVELTDYMIYNAYEEAITEYSKHVNEFNIKENLLFLKGTPIHGSNASTTPIRQNLGYFIKVAKEYGNETPGAGGTVTWRSGSIDMQQGVQHYDLNKLFRDVVTPGEEIEIKRIYHYQIPAINRYFDPMAMTGGNFSGMMDQFGFGGMSPAVTFMMMPIYEDMLRIQAIELNDHVRKSGYGWELTNNNLTILPMPSQDTKLWFDYILISDRDNAFNSTTPTGSVSDFSNAPYQLMNYTNINMPGKQWIRRYTYSLCKEILGHIRGKYQSIPIPGAEVSMDGSNLLDEARGEKEILVTQLREILEMASVKNQMEAKQAEADNLKSILSKVPLNIYIG